MKNIKIKVKINNVFKEFYVPNNLTVLGALEYINKEYGENINIQYRASCKAGQCGSCTMTINGEPKLACKTKLEYNLKIEPLKNFIVIKDLIVDRGQYYIQLNKIRNYTDNNLKINKDGIINNNKNTIEDIEKIKKIRGCIDCMACLSTCPSREYSEYCGPTIIRQLARFEFDKRDKLNRCEIAFSEKLPNCTTCGKCVEVCPKEIDIVHNAIEKLREEAFKKGYYLDEHIEVRKNVLQNEKHRTVSKETTPLLEEVNEEYTAKHEIMKVAFFTGCLVDYRLQDVGKSAIKLLNAHGISVIIPKNQVCCGSPFIRTGQSDVAQQLKSKNLEIFNNLKELGVEGVVTVCAGCGSTLKNDYKEKEFNVMDITELLNKVGLTNYKPYEMEGNKKIKITYHDPCHLRRGQGIAIEPRKILKHIPNVELIEMDEIKCCGAGGGVRSGVPQLAKVIGKSKVKSILKTNADIVITVCPFCEYHIKDSLKEYKKENNIEKDIKVMNIASLVEKVI